MLSIQLYFQSDKSFFFSGVQMQKKEKYDKHDSPNPNRSNTFMSAEDLAAGKKSAWYELEITG